MTAGEPAFHEASKIVFAAEVGSTNDEARRLLLAGAPAWTLFWAGSQSGGRGRDGRAWSSPPGNLYASLVLRPPGAPARVAQLAFVAAVAIGEALQGILPAGRRVSLKWPNDVLADGRKVAGILLESEGARADGVDGLVVGFGVNVASFPGEARLPATSLRAEGAGDIQPREVLAACLRALRHRYDAWATQGFAPVRAAWLEAAHGLGAPAIARLPDREIRGTFAGLAEGGEMLLETPDGPRRVSAGDVFFAPPA
jgi:BirA family biotin operon repressor/biotin-[acetyl-CoA-carboxylase] ligase